MRTRSSAPYRRAAATRAPSPVPVVRRLDLVFDPASVPRDWYGHDAHLSTFFNGLSLLFPEGEKFFVQSVRHFASRIDDAGLKRRVAAFIGQEALHSAEHRSFNEMLRAQGDELVVRLEREVRWLLILGHRALTPKAQLAVTCALEHYTAILAEQLLSLPEHQAAIDDALRPLWLWHALEESEHKAVAFDVYRAVGGSERTRVWTMKGVRIAFVVSMAVMVLVSVLRDSATYRRGNLRRSIKRVRQSPLLTREVWNQLKDYDRPDFHPDDRDTRTMEAEWRERLFGADGELSGLLAGSGAAA